MFLWVDTFSGGPKLPEVRTAAMQACRETLVENGFTFSSEVTTAVALAPVEIRSPSADDDR